MASIAAGIIIFTQLWLVASGNFAWLNWIAIVLAFAAVSDPVAHAVLPVLPLDWHAAGGAGWQTPLWWLVITLAATVLLVVLSYWPIRNLFSHHQLMNASFNRWQLVNTYGAFGTVTKQRIEVAVEGTLDQDPDDVGGLAGVRIQGQARGRPPAAAAMRPLPSAARLADVVPAAADCP